MVAADDRVHYGGDPDFVDIPLERLISSEYAEQVRSRIALDRASEPPAERYGRSEIDLIPEYATFPRVPTPGPTTHFATADGEGNVVTVTQTLGGGFGSGFAPGGTGVFLNNMGKWFDIDPGYGSPNIVAPGKRVDFCVSPVQVFSGDDIALSIGTPGSYGILHTSVQMIHAFVDGGMNVQEAIEAPRFRHYDTGDVFYEDRVPQGGSGAARADGPPDRQDSGVDGFRRRRPRDPVHRIRHAAGRGRPAARRGGGGLVEHTESPGRGILAADAV